MSTKKQHPYSAPKSTTSDMGYPYERLSWSKKKAYDFKWVERVADFYDYYHGSYRNSEYLEKLETNYNLFDGRGKDAMKAYHKDYAAELELEGLNTGYDEPQHYPIINQIARAMVGEQQRRPLSAVAVDSSRYNMNIRKLKRNELMQQWIQETILQPIQQQAFQIIMERTGVNDPYMLSPEQQDEFQSMLNQQIQSMTPDEIDNYMRKDYKSPSETQAQKILDFLIQDLNVKYLTDEAFKHFIVSGKEVVRVYVSHGKVKMEVVNPMGFDYSASSNTHFIEDGEWAKYEEYIKYPDIFTKLGDKIGTKELKVLENEFLAFAQGGSSLAPGGWTSAQGYHHHLDAQLVSTVAAHNYQNQIFDKAPDIRTKEGQKFMQAIYNRFGSHHNNYDSVRHVHIAFKALRKFKYVTRKRDGTEKSYWLDESYVFNPDRGDHKEEIVWIPQVWECDKFGTKEGIYINKRPLPDQYKSINNPWDVKLPYIGIEFNRMFENSKQVAPLDFGKPWQYLINVELAKIQELNATDVGNILVASQGMLPKDWSPGKFFAMMKHSKTAWVNPDQEGVTPVDSSLIKGVSLSNTPEMLGRVNYLQFLIQMMTQSLSYNPSRMGQNDKYMAVTNAQQNIIQSSYQTEDIYNTHNMFLENVLNALVRAGKTAFRDNAEMRTYILDDMSVAELEVDWTVLDPAELGVKIRNSSEDFMRVQQIKQLAQAMVQNDMITLPELIKLQYANNGAEVMNLAEFAQQNAMQRRQMEHQQALEQIQAQGQLGQQMEELKLQMQLILQNAKADADYRKTIDAAAINSTRFAQQKDINENNIADSQEQKKMELQHEKEENQKDREHELKMKKIDEQLKKAEMRMKQRSAKSKT